jgi:hypothetical protein
VILYQIALPQAIDIPLSTSGERPASGVAPALRRSFHADVGFVFNGLTPKTDGLMRLFRSFSF